MNLTLQVETVTTITWCVSGSRPEQKKSERRHGQWVQRLLRVLGECSLLLEKVINLSDQISFSIQLDLSSCSNSHKDCFSRLCIIIVSISFYSSLNAPISVTKPPLYLKIWSLYIFGRLFHLARIRSQFHRFRVVAVLICCSLNKSLVEP